MRILHVVPTYLPAWRYGGPIHSVHGLCKALAACGHEVHVATTNGDGPGQTDVPLDRPVDVDGVHVHYFACRPLRALYHSPPLRRFVASGIRTWDALHLHSVFLWPTTAAARLARAARTPYVVSPRGMLVPDLIARRSRWAKRAWIAAFERRNLAEAAAVHVTSALERTGIEQLGLRVRRFIEIPNGFSPPVNGKALPPPGLPGKYALFLGRISWKKGLDRLLRALVEAPDVTVVIAGNDDENYWDSMARLAAGLGVASRVRRIGFVDGGEKLALLRGARLLVLPSYSENFGNVVLEAMSLALPVVITPEVGLADAITASGSGIVVGAEPRALGGALSSLWHDDGLHATLAAAARGAAVAFEWQSVAHRFETEYRSILAPAPNAC